MSSEFGRNIRVTLYGESHGKAVGAVVSGLPVGEEINLDMLQAFMDRRAPGRDNLRSARREKDRAEVLSGLYMGRTSGAPLAVVIENGDKQSGDYERMRDIPRPGHGDYPASVRYAGFADPNGGGHRSGRITAGLCAAGGICLQILARRGVTVGARLARCAGIEDVSVDSTALTAAELRSVAEKPIPVFDGGAGIRMMEAIAAARASGDSVGGVIEAFALGVPPGLGSPVFDGVENRVSCVLFGIPGVKGVDFGLGFGEADLTGSQNNDPFILRDSRVCTCSNRHGGVLGGMTTGMPLVVRAAVKPTPSIAREQHTLNTATGEMVSLAIGGRHDGCIAQRAVPCVEAALALVLMDMMMDGEYCKLPQ